MNRLKQALRKLKQCFLYIVNYSDTTNKYSESVEYFIVNDKLDKTHNHFLDTNLGDILTKDFKDFTIVHDTGVAYENNSTHFRHESITNLKEGFARYASSYDGYKLLRLKGYDSLKYLEDNKMFLNILSGKVKIEGFSYS